MKTKAIKGFTLLEIMVALAILAGVAASVVQILASGVDVTNDVEMQSQAYILAESKMDETLLQDHVQDAVGTGAIEDTPFQYEISVEPQEYPGKERGFALWHITVAIFWGEDDYRTSVKLESLKTEVRQR